eukprot:TRINITY_DN102231_c0_g1_i1.p1 TRINITY_DN102231_c0_g1~~TRINITY_DN102231_c0_g1_i1.p1  ORF type:complete len:464 (-),score=88.45 TRINITY_DN102231_c0_g1_i1:35-1426(-)
MNKYLELGVAGEGAYGVVLKCKDKATGELLAVKRFHEPDEGDEEALRFTQREVKLLRSLKHENIIELKEVFRQKGILHLVFEYMEKCLLDVLDANPAGLGSEAARPLTRQLTRALEHCHSHNVIHRDIKPDNLLINPSDNSLKLCDFGSACKMSGKAPLTDYVATRWYRAPELLVRSNDYGKPADMWSLGCVMTELTVGKALFAGESDIDQLHLIHKTLGPLTPEQQRRSMELTHAAEIRFQPGAPSDTLRQRFTSSMPDAQVGLLEQLVVMDPSQRLTARAALAAPWLHAGLVKAESSRPSSRGRLPAAQQKPRVRHGAVSPAPGFRPQQPSLSLAASPPLVGITPRVVAEQIEAQEVQELQESIEESLARHHFPRDRSPQPDICDESIPEEIHSPKALLEVPEGILEAESLGSESTSRPASRSRSSPPPMQLTSKPTAALVKRTRPASSRRDQGGLVSLGR